MNVIQPGENDPHLLAWLNFQAKKLGEHIPLYSLKASLHSGRLTKILASVDDCYFGALHTDTDIFEEIFTPLQEFMNKQCGRRIKLELKNKILKNFQMEILVSLSLFACLHSKKKSEFISHVMQLSQEVQSGLMSHIQEVTKYTESILQIKDILARVQELQNQAQALKNELGISNSREEFHLNTIKDLEEDLSRSSKDLKQIKEEKQHALQTLKLTTFDQYLSSFQKMQEENKLLTKYANELEENNEEQERNHNDLKECIKNQMSVIADLNDQITFLKQRYNFLKMDKNHQISSEETLDASRSFGTQIITSSRENLDISQIQMRNKGSQLSNLTDWYFEEDLNRENILDQELGLQTEMEQLRKQNQELVRKLEDASKTMNILRTQCKEIKEKNKTIKIENKFYRGQVEGLRKLHGKFERKYLAGEL